MLHKKYFLYIAAVSLLLTYFITASIQYKVDNEETIRPLFSLSFFIIFIITLVYFKWKNFQNLIVGFLIFPPNILLLIFFSLTLLSGKLYSERSYIDAIYSVTLWFGICLMLGLYFMSKTNEITERMELIFKTIIVFALLSTIVAILTFFGMQLEFGEFKLEQQLWVFPRIHGYMGEPTSLGALLGFALLLHWYFNQRQNKSFLFIIIALFIGIGLIWSGSRNAIISLVVSITYYQLAKGNVREISKLVKKIIIIVLMLILFIAMSTISDPSELASTVMEALDRQDYDGDNENSRLLIWGNTLRLLGESQVHEIIIGHGNGALRSAYRAAFNSPLEIMFDYGLIGLIIFLSWIFTMLASSFKRSRTSMSNISALAGAFVVYGFVFNLFISWFPSPHFNFALFSFEMGATLIFILNRIGVGNPPSG